MVQFGAGNIGRSFIGRLFSEAGFDVVFIDVDKTLVDLLNQRGGYPVVVKQLGRNDEVRQVRQIRAVDGRDQEAVVRELVQADYWATSVGLRALDSVLEGVARGLLARQSAGRPAVDLIIAENLRNGAELYRNKLKAWLPPGFPLESRLGLVETSIGKMVPLMPRKALDQDPLQLFAEPYDTLIVDRHGFLTGLPPLVGLKPVENVPAYVDRKLFLHNMSHAATAYLGYQADPTRKFLWEALEIPSVAVAVAGALGQSSQALLAEYPSDFTAKDLADHGADLLDRYRNRALGDTVYRVGRDLKRKLSREDRLVGACLLAARHGLPYDKIARVVKAALDFQACDEKGGRSPSDGEWIEKRGLVDDRQLLVEVSGLRPEDPGEVGVIEAILRAPRG